MTKSKIVLLAIVALVIGFTLGVYGDRAANSGALGATVYDVLHQAGDLRQGLNDVLMFTNGTFVGPIASTTIGTGGTKISIYSCTSVTWNPGAVGSTTVATVDVPATSTANPTGPALGDLAFASIATSTQGLTIEGNVSSTGVISALLSDGDNSGAAIDIATTTLKVCYIH